MLKYISIRIIKTYRVFFSQSFGHNCRFYPTCSCYALYALESNSFLKAWSRIFWRILRCNPLSSGGYDPISPKAKLILKRRQQCDQVGAL